MRNACKLLVLVCEWSLEELPHGDFCDEDPGENGDWGESVEGGVSSMVFVLVLEWVCVCVLVLVLE